jgi:hypothetical protein
MDQGSTLVSKIGFLKGLDWTAPSAAAIVALRGHCMGRVAGRLRVGK